MTARTVRIPVHLAWGLIDTLEEAVFRGGATVRDVDAHRQLRELRRAVGEHRPDRHPHQHLLPVGRGTVA